MNNGIEHEIDEVPYGLSDRWISVGDRLPDEDSFYLVWIYDGQSVILSRLEAGGRWQVGGFYFKPEDVTHWQHVVRPLPPDWKEIEAQI